MATSLETSLEACLGSEGVSSYGLLEIQLLRPYTHYFFQSMNK